MITEKNFSFKSSDGRNNISAKYWIPESAPIAVLQITHGMVEYKERYDGFARFMAENGFLVCAHDHLGHGDSVSTVSDWGYINEKSPSDFLVEDMNGLRKIASQEYPGIPYYMLGHSMGSFMLRKYITRYGEGLSAAVIMGTGHNGSATAKVALGLTGTLALVKGWRHRSDFIQGLAFGESYKKYDLTGTDTSNSWLTKDTAIVEKYYKDPKCTYKFTLAGYKALFEAVGAACDVKAAGAIPKDLPLLIVSGADDPVGDCGAGVEKAYKMYCDAGLHDITMKLFQGDRHEILNELDRETVYAYIFDFLKSKM